MNGGIPVNFGSMNSFAPLAAVVELADVVAPALRRSGATAGARAATRAAASAAGDQRRNSDEAQGQPSPQPPMDSYVLHRVLSFLWLPRRFRRIDIGVFRRASVSPASHVLGHRLAAAPPPVLRAITEYADRGASPDRNDQQHSDRDRLRLARDAGKTEDVLQHREQDDRDRHAGDRPGATVRADPAEDHGRDRRQQLIVADVAWAVW